MSNDKRELLASVSKIDETLNKDLSNLTGMLDKLNIALHKLNLEYQWMKEENRERGEV